MYYIIVSCELGKESQMAKFLSEMLTNVNDKRKGGGFLVLLRLHSYLGGFMQTG